MQPVILKWIGFMWAGFAVVWLLGALTQKRAVRRDSVWSRFVQVALGILVILLLWKHGLHSGLLVGSYVPRPSALSILGLALTFAGLAFAVTARIFIGRNWSGMVTVKKDHKLVRNGPYALVRHPIYTCTLLAVLGTVIAFGATQGLPGVGLATVILWIKSRREELLMAQEFGDEYTQYKQKVKALIPFVW